VVEKAADAAMTVVAAMIADAGGDVEALYIAFSTTGLPEGEQDSVAASSGSFLEGDVEERAKAVVAWLVTEAASAGKALGLDIRIVPMAQVGGQG